MYSKSIANMPYNKHGYGDSSDKIKCGAAAWHTWLWMIVDSGSADN